MAKPPLTQALTFTYRILVLLLLLANAWLLRSIDRYQYTGPTYEDEQQARQVTARLEDIEKTLSYIEKNTRR